jgi:hypothetical protein
MQYTHVSFSDESNWNSGRYRSIGMLSAARSDALSLHHEASKLLLESRVKELRWNKIRTSKQQFAAEKAIDSCAQALSDNRLRIDVLVWDSQGDRPRVQNTDLKATLQVMYYLLFKNVTSRRWPSDCIWRHVPDQHVGVGWDALESYLSAKDTQNANERSFDTAVPASESFSASIKRLFNIAEIMDCRAQEMCLTQLADLFAGMGAFSREKFNEYRSWKRNRGYTSTLFEATAKRDSTFGLLEKYHVLSHFEGKLSELAFPVALDQTSGLRTLDPSIPINFWWYEAQSRFDKAFPKQTNDFPWKADEQ